MRRVLRRDKCPDYGADGLARWVGWGILTHNLAKIGQTVARRLAPRAVVLQQSLFAWQHR